MEKYPEQPFSHKSQSNDDDNRSRYSVYPHDSLESEPFSEVVQQGCETEPVCGGTRAYRYYYGSYFPVMRGGIPHAEKSEKGENHENGPRV